MRRFGAMPYITPLQRATESSTIPKSVINTTVGGGCGVDCCARKGMAARSRRVKHSQNCRADLTVAGDVIRIGWDALRRILEINTLQASHSGLANRDSKGAPD